MSDKMSQAEVLAFLRASVTDRDDIHEDEDLTICVIGWGRLDRDDVWAVFSALAAATERERVLREALAWYASDEAMGVRHQGEEPPIVLDGGQRARAALAQTEGR